VTGRRASRLKFLALGFVPLILTSCVAEYENPTLSPKPLPVADTLTPVMTRPQLERILADVDGILSLADANLDRESVEVRVSGPALQMRRFAYNLARRTEDPANVPPAINISPIQLFLPSATDAWPRSVMVVTGDRELQLLVLQQQSARDQYKLFHYIDCLNESPAFIHALADLAAIHLQGWPVDSAGRGEREAAAARGAVEAKLAGAAR
jgi:hypothetical protein